jgi:hypothetical protein
MAMTAKEQLAAKIAAMTEDEASEALSLLDAMDAPLSAEEDALLRARLDAAVRPGVLASPLGVDGVGVSFALRQGTNATNTGITWDALRAPNGASPCRFD